MTEARIMGGTLAAFLALTAWVGLRGVPGIEEGLRSAVADTLAFHGVAAASVSVRGRTVTVVGGPEDPGDRLALSVALNSVPGVRRVVSPLGQAQAESRGRPIRVADGSVTMREAPRDSPVETDSDERAEPADAMTADVAGEALPTLASGAGGGGAEDPGDSEEEESSPREGPAPALSCGDRLIRLAEGRTLPFLEGESTIAEVDRAVLADIASALVRCGEWTLTIVGFTGRNERQDAWVLADRRAYAVARFIMDRGVDESRIATVTGSSPLDSEGEPRVELVVSGGM